MRIQRGRDILQEFQDSIGDIVITSSFDGAIQMMLDCDGKIITTGMGKAGIAMRKFSSTLCSLGFPSCYLHPGEASHGDLGMIDNNDILFVASTSGKTREVLEVLQQSQHVKHIIGITSHVDSPIREYAEVTLDMGEVEEAGQLKIAPTSSILVMLAITDALALVASEERNFTTKDFYLRHHNGYLADKCKSS